MRSCFILRLCTAAAALVNNTCFRSS
jgi:hypothetical protein